MSVGVIIIISVAVDRASFPYDSAVKIESIFLCEEFVTEITRRGCIAVFVIEVVSPDVFQAVYVSTAFNT